MDSQWILEKNGGSKNPSTIHSQYFENMLISFVGYPMNGPDTSFQAESIDGLCLRPCPILVAKQALYDKNPWRTYFDFNYIILSKTILTVSWMDSQRKHREYIKKTFQMSKEICIY